MTLSAIGLTINLIFCIIIFLLGIWAYVKIKSLPALYIGIAFFLYAVSHVLGLMGLAESLNLVGLVTRIIGYLLTIYAICLLVFKR